MNGQSVDAQGVPERLGKFFLHPDVLINRTPTCWPEGFRGAGGTAGLKESGAPDVMLLINEGPQDSAAALFTSNRFAAAPVLWSQEAVKDGRARAVFANSGGANACTGPEGFLDTHQTAETLARTLSVQGAGNKGAGNKGAEEKSAEHLSPVDCLIASTGLIGERLDTRRLFSALEKLPIKLDQESVEDTARAIMTTDTVPKRAEVTLDSGARIVGIAKGAGMLAPALATMLVFIATDAVIEPRELRRALRDAGKVSFDRADADGCMSTNDTVIALASGSSEKPAGEDFASALAALCQDLAYQLIDDAEGGHHSIAVTTTGAASEAEALEVCREIARSNLVKTAIFGQDPNWGRILSAVGSTRATFEPQRVNVSFNGVQICAGGGSGEKRELVDLEGREVSIVVDLGAGSQQATILTSDLTHDYVHENSAYST